MWWTVPAPSNDIASMLLPPDRLDRASLASSDRLARPHGRRCSVGVSTAHGRWLSEAISFGRELRFDHLCNEAMLVAQELHHFEGRRDCLGYGRLGGMPPLAV